MNQIWKSCLLMALPVFALTVTPAYSQSSAGNDPGYVDLYQRGRLDEIFEGDARIEVNIEGSLMRMVAAASRIEDPELADLLLKLKGVYVRGYSLMDQNIERIQKRANLIGDELQKEGWSFIVRIRRPDEHVQMLVRFVEDQIVGMVVISIEDASDEAMFVNIVGEIDPEQIGRIGRKFHLGGVKEL